MAARKRKTTEVKETAPEATESQVSEGVAEPIKEAAPKPAAKKSTPKTEPPAELPPRRVKLTLRCGHCNTEMRRDLGGNPYCPNSHNH